MGPLSHLGNKPPGFRFVCAVRLSLCVRLSYMEVISVWHLCSPGNPHPMSFFFSPHDSGVSHAALCRKRTSPKTFYRRLFVTKTLTSNWSIIILLGEVKSGLVRTWGVMEAVNNLREYLCAFKSIIAVFCAFFLLICCFSAWMKLPVFVCFFFFRISPGAVVHSEHLTKKKSSISALFKIHIKYKAEGGRGLRVALQHSEQVCLRVNKRGHTRVHGGFRRLRTAEYSANSCCLHSVLLNL